MTGKLAGKVLAAGTAAGAAGLGATVLWAGWERFWVNWIVWFLFVLTAGLGCLFIVALEHLVGAKWSVPLRRVPERLSGLVLLMAPAMLLALFSLPQVYSWAKPDGPDDAIVAAKAAWLNIPFFAARTAACVLLWFVAYRILVRGSFRQDSERDARFNVRARRFAPAFMVIFAVTITLATFDWISSLAPAWYSDVFGIYVFAGTFLAGLSATALAVIYLAGHNRLPGVRSDHLYNLGGFLFAFTVFWSYIGFAQYMLMWYANLPEEVFWYRDRLEGSWGILVLVLAAVHFAFPFFVLVPRAAKGDPRKLLWVAGLMLLAHWLDLYWMVFPALGRGPLFGWPELAAALFFVCLALLWIGRAMKEGADMPVGDPFLHEGLEFRL